MMCTIFRSRPVRFLPLLFVLASCATFQRGPDPAALLTPASPSLAEQSPPQYHVQFETSRGPFVMEVNREWAPLGADRFYNLVRHGFYDGARFFRVLPDFVVQFGIPGDTALSQIWSEQHIQDDPVVQSNRRGYVSFAMAGPDTRTAQVFINLAENQRLDAMGFAPFGRIVEGMEIVQSLFAGYGEGPPRGSGPDQDLIEREGTPYLEREFPLLDYIQRARLVRR